MTPMQWVANELSIELRAKQIASHTLEYISKEMGVSPASLSYYIDSGMPAPEHAYLYCKRAFHINLDYVLTALRSKRAMRGSRKKCRD